MTDDILVARLVHLEPGARARRTVLQMRSVAAVLGGGVLVLGGLSASISAFSDGFSTGVLVGGLVSLVLSVWLVWLGWRMMRALLDRGPDTGSRDAMPVAFTVDGSEISFPAVPGVPSEQWPLSETRVQTFSSLGFTSLQLSRSGCRTRRYGNGSLASTPGVVAGRISALAAAPYPQKKVDRS